MSGQWIYSSGDDLGFLNGTAYLQLSLARPFSARAVIFVGFISASCCSCRDDSLLASEIDLNCKVSTLFAVPSLDERQGVSTLRAELTEDKWSGKPTHKPSERNSLLFFWCCEK